MKTKFYFLPILLLGGLSLFTACSDDDDEKGGGQPATPEIGPGGTNSGARLTSISKDWGAATYIQYNEDGTVQRIFEAGDDGEAYDWIAMTYNPFRMETEEMGELKDISFNQNGYLTHYSAEDNYIDEEDDYWEKYKEDWRFSYNGNGNLTKIVGTYSYNGVEDGESYSGHGTCNTTYNWSNGNVTQIKIVYNGFDEDGSWMTENTYDIEYTDEINKYQQYVIGLYDIDADNGLDEKFEPIGWLGKWTKNYPASYEHKRVEEESDGEKYENTHTGTWSNFSTTSDGLLSGFSYDGSPYTYTYDNTAPTAKKVAAKQTLGNSIPSPRTKKMSRRHLRHARMLNRQ